ncbi:hypothetical protein BGZ72_007505 [Mortierella alpina]|nr:hypothetical protein BGZ72_007505 [Mortierella alpina]
MAQPAAQDKGVNAAAVKVNNDHLFHMDILDIDEYGEDDDDDAFDEGDYNYDAEDEDDSDYDDDGVVDLAHDGDTVGSEIKAGSVRGSKSDRNGNSNSPTHPSSDRGFHYADPLMIPSTDQEQCHIKHKRDETHSEQTSIPQDPSQPATAGSEMDGQLRALVNYEPGGACLDSFVNFALRFRERCTISCLKILTHIFAKPDVLGLVGCFGCINFLISGLSAVITDCSGLFTPYPKPSSSAGNPKPTGTVKKTTADNLAAQGLFDSASLPIPVQPDGQGLGTLDFKQVIQSLQNIDLNQVQDWLDLGKKIVESTTPTAKDQKAEDESTKAQNLKHEDLEDEETIGDKDIFNNFIIKAASFANWTVTPEMLEISGVYDRFHSA